MITTASEVNTAEMNDFSQEFPIAGIVGIIIAAVLVTSSLAVYFYRKAQRNRHAIKRLAATVQTNDAGQPSDAPIASETSSINRDVTEASVMHQGESCSALACTSGDVSSPSRSATSSMIEVSDTTVQLTASTVRQSVDLQEPREASPQSVQAKWLQQQN